MSCIDTNAMTAYVEGTLGQAELAGVEQHLAACTECRTLLSAVARVGEDDPSCWTSLPDSLGDSGEENTAVTAVHGDRSAWADLTDQVLQETYVVERRIGRGGMGVVYEASHLRLDRRFAIKAISPRSRSWRRHNRGLPRPLLARGGR